MGSAASPEQTCAIPGHPTEPVFDGDYSFNTGIIKSLVAADYLVLVAALCGPLLIGLYQAWENRKSVTIEQFLLAYRSMTPVPVGCSICACFTSAITMLGMAAETYDQSTMFIWVVVGLVMAAAASAHIYHPVFYRLGLITSFEYLELRFSKSVRTVAATMFMLQMLVYISIVLYAPTAALQKVTGFPLWGALISTSVVCIIVTAFAGMRGIVWADVYYVVLMFLSLLVVLFRAVQVVGGWEQLWASNVRSHRVLFDEYRLHFKVRHSVWSVVLGGFFTFSSSLAGNQPIVQKIVSCYSLRDGQIAVYVSITLSISLSLLSCLLGLYMGAFYENCDPMQVDLVENSNQLLPLFATDILSASYGMVGLFIAGLFSGSLSTISSALSAASVSIIKDFIQDRPDCQISEGKARCMAQPIVFVFGLLCLLGVFLVSTLGNVLQVALTVFGLTAAPVLGVMSLGMFCPWANTQGALWGLCGSVSIILALCVATRFSNFIDWSSLRCIRNCELLNFSNFTFTDVGEASMAGGADLSMLSFSYIWFAMVAITSCITIGLVVSLVTGPEDPETINSDLLVSLCDVVFPFFYLPESFRSRLRINRETVPMRPRRYVFSPDESCPSSSNIQLGTFVSPRASIVPVAAGLSPSGSPVD